MRRTAVIASLALLAGCATAPGPSCVRLARSGWFCPLPPAALAPRVALRLVTVSHGGRSEHFLGQLATSEQQLTLALSSLAGIPLATVTWDGTRTATRPAKAPFRAGLITAMLELTLAPPAALRGALHGLHLSVTRTADGRERRLTTDGGALVAVARRHAGVERIEVPTARLTVTLAPVATSS